MSEQAQSPQRPLIIVFMVITFAFSGVVAAVMGLALETGSQMAGGLIPNFGFRGQLAGAAIALLGILLDVFGVFLISAAYGLWTAQRWGKRLSMLLCMFSAGTGVIGIIFTLFSHNRSVGSLLTQLFGILLYAYFFMRLSVLTTTVTAPAPLPVAAAKQFCTQCGTPAREGTAVCTNCGARL